jgi:hypothetical protein
VRVFQVLQNGLAGIPGGDADAHAAFREQPCATRADAGAAPDDDGNVVTRFHGLPQ